MSFDYDFTYAMGEEFGAAFGVLYIVYYLFVFGLGIASYVLGSLGVYTIAKRRGISNPWLAWIPVANSWVLGSVSDQYRYVSKGQIKSKRKILLAMNIVMVLIYVVFFVVMIAGMVDVIGLAMTEVSEDALFASAMSMMLGMLGVALVMLVAAIAVAIVRYMALYDLYTSVDPAYNVVFLVLSIIISVTEPFFIFFNRKKDLGMPPRCDVPQEPVVYTVPEYIPPQPIIQEPWEKTEE